jgi:cytochrome P450 monooxygenase
MRSCSVSADSLPFGLGKFACPGRFFAAALIKQFLIELITNYEFRFPGGQEKRPENIFLDERIAPNTNQAMEFTRKVSS